MTGWTVTLNGSVAERLTRFIGNQCEGQAFCAEDGTVRLSQEAFDFLIHQRPRSEFSIGGFSGPPEEFDLWVYDDGYPLSRVA